jgi:hypothetical protein
MTLELYDADRLDQTALRILDIAAEIRRMAAVLRRDPQIELAMHDKKAAEWLTHLERWAAESQARLEMALIKRRGAMKAESLSPAGKARLRT